MRRFLFAVAIAIPAFFAVAHAETIGPAPQCRLQDVHKSAVHDALQRALKVLDPDQKTVSAVSINSYQNGDGTLNIQIITDADFRRVDHQGCAPKVTEEIDVVADRFTQSTSGMCAVEFTPAPLLKCSASSIDLLMKDAKDPYHPSESLLYILAHELSHVLHHDKAAFAPLLVRIALSDAVEQKWSSLRDVCRDQAQSFPLEVRADDEAITVLSKLLVKPPYKDSTLTPAASLGMAVGRLRLTADHLQASTLNTGEKRRLPRSLVDPHLPSSQAEVHEKGDRALCEVLTENEGELVMPMAGGSHPDAARRMRAISKRLAEFARSLPASPPAPGTPTAGNFDDLIKDTSTIFSILDLEEADLWKDFGDYVCKTWINPQVTPNCREIMSRPDVVLQEDCRSFHATLKEVPYGGKRLVVSGKRALNGTIHLDQPVRFAVPLTGGGVMLGVGDAIAILEPGGAVGEAFRVGCRPSWATGSRKKTFVACQSPGGIIEATDGKPTRLSTFESGGLDDETITGADLSLEWIGSVGQQLVAMGQVGHAGGFTFRVGDGQLTLQDAWRSKGCSKLRSGFALWSWKDASGVTGTTWNKTASTEVAGFSTGAVQVLDIADPSTLPEIPETEGVEALEKVATPPVLMGCGPSYQHSAAVCVDDSGSIFVAETTGKNRKIGRFEVSEALRRAKVYSARVCGTKTSLYFIAVAERPDVTTEIWQLKKDASNAVKLGTAATNDAGLACNEEEAFAWHKDDAGSAVIRLQ